MQPFREPVGEDNIQRASEFLRLLRGSGQNDGDLCTVAVLRVARGALKRDRLECVFGLVAFLRVALKSSRNPLLPNDWTYVVTEGMDDWRNQ